MRLVLCVFLSLAAVFCVLVQLFMFFYVWCVIINSTEASQHCGQDRVVYKGM